ncbi:hypothetical protein ACTFIR_007529 [Dictyostelium discoideum]
MLESFLQEGTIRDRDLSYISEEERLALFDKVSHVDPCLGWDETQTLIHEALFYKLQTYAKTIPSIYHLLLLLLCIGTGCSSNKNWISAQIYPYGKKFSFISARYTRLFKGHARSNYLIYKKLKQFDLWNSD